ncbi:MAG: hypothetical protein LBD13_05085 [Spirochaetaceae bacterium]|nr:hypothetical protein [Spirochaetaceae bacterium]
MGRKRLPAALLALAAAGCFLGCVPESGGTYRPEGPDGPGAEANRTFVTFHNDLSRLPVTVYSDPQRTIKLADLEVGGAKQVPALPSPNGTPFYMTYHITIDQIAFPYYDGSSFSLARIDPERDTPVPVPALTRFAVSKAYVKITNNGAFALIFKKESSEFTPEGSASTIVMSGEAAVYILEAGAIAGYAFMENGASPLDFPAALSGGEFEAGHIYSFTYNGSALVLDRTTIIGLGMINAPPCILDWQGGWMRAGQDTYTSTRAGGSQRTVESAAVHYTAPSKITVELAASGAGGYGAAFPLDRESGEPLIQVSNTESQTCTYVVPPGPHRIYFAYVTDLSGGEGNGRVTVKVQHPIAQAPVLPRTPVTPPAPPPPSGQLYPGTTFAWSGHWRQNNGQNSYTSNDISDNQFTREILTVTAAQALDLTIELAASSEERYDCGRAFPLDTPDSSGVVPTIEVSGAEVKIHTYRVPPGTHQIYFTYKKDGSRSVGSDSATVKILSAAAVSPPELSVYKAWSGSWRSSGEDEYTSSPIAHGESTEETLTITTNRALYLTVELAASSEADWDYGYAAMPDAPAQMAVGVSGSGQETYTYTILPGTRQITFGYKKDACLSERDDNVTVKIRSIEIAD